MHLWPPPTFLHSSRGMATLAGPSTARAPRPSSRFVDDEAELYASIARLSIQDIDELEARQRRNYGRPVSTDAELAIRMAREEVEALDRFNSDRALARTFTGRDAAPQTRVIATA